MSRKNLDTLKKMSFNLRNLRKKKNYTQMYVSFHIGIDCRLYQKYESNNPPDIRLTNLLKILNFYKTPLETLLK